MRTFLADLHIHTLLSPCGDLEMTPRMVVEKSLERGLSIIAISDHNSTRMGEIIAAFAATKGLTVLPAVVIVAVIGYVCTRARGTVHQVGRGMLVGCLSAPLTVAIFIPAWIIAQAIGPL